MELKVDGKNLELFVNGRKIIAHSSRNPFVFVGKGEATFDMYRGNYDIKDYVIERVGLVEFEVLEENKVKFFRGEEFLNVSFEEKDGKVSI